MHYLTLPSLLLLIATQTARSENYTRYSDRNEVKVFIEEIAERHNLNRAELLGIFRDIEPQSRALELMSKPAETALSWKQYRPIFFEDSRIQGGVAFWQEHAETLQHAQQKYGVPPEIIVAIIGVETKYGKITGRFPILATLTTLAFDFERRKSFFQSELEQFLLLARDEQLDLFAANGSYAGAMGLPQFIPSSYRSYAVDFNQDGRRDLWNSHEDVIGSVANYFQRHGWETEKIIVSRAKIEGDISDLAVGRERKGLKPEKTLRELATKNIRPVEKLDKDLQAILIYLDGEKGDEHWLGFQNFYVITRYNQSAMYAMAVYQLSQAIKSQKQNPLAQVDKTPTQNRPNNNDKNN